MNNLYSRNSVGISSLPLVFSFNVTKQEGKIPSFDVGIYNSNNITDNHFNLHIDTIVNEGTIEENNSAEEYKTEIFLNNKVMFVENVISNSTTNDDYSVKVFFLTEEPSMGKSIKGELGFYEMADEEIYSVAANVIGTIEEDIILLDSDDVSETILRCDYTVSKEYSKENITKYTFLSLEDEEIVMTSPVDKILRNESYRARFVISNSCRVLSFSIYDTENKIWKTIRTLVLNNKPIDSNTTYYVRFAYNNATVNNITTNF